MQGGEIAPTLCDPRICSVAALYRVAGTLLEGKAIREQSRRCGSGLPVGGYARFAAVTVRHEPRAVGRSNYSLGKLVLHTLNLVTGFST